MSTNTSPNDFTISKGCINLFSKYAGITNESELRNHILTIHQKAVAARPYRCIREFRFITLRAQGHPFYETAVQEFLSKLSKTTTTQRQPQLCDLGCALGTDLRQFIIDGIPGSLATGIDISEELISLGFELFREDCESLRQPITWMVADVLSSDISSVPSSNNSVPSTNNNVPSSDNSSVPSGDISSVPSSNNSVPSSDISSVPSSSSYVLSGEGDISSIPSSNNSNVPSGDNSSVPSSSSYVLSGDGDISSVPSTNNSSVPSSSYILSGDGVHKKFVPLSHYSGYFDLIYTGAVIHLFPEDTVKKFLVHAIQMLCPHGTIFGKNVGAREKPFVANRQDPRLGSSLRYLHTKDSIKELLEELGLVEVESWALENKDNNRDVVGDEFEQRSNMISLCWKGVKPALPSKSYL